MLAGRRALNINNTCLAIFLTHMAKVIGTGDSAVRNFVSQCKAAGGIPIIRDKYGGNVLPNGEVVVACWGKASQVPGGTITGVSSAITDLLSSNARGKYKQLM